jgi:hypothetical protein
MALRRRGSDQKVLTPPDELSRAAIRSETQRASLMKSMQVPTIAKIMGQQHCSRKAKKENCRKTYITATRKHTR